MRLNPPQLLIAAFFGSILLGTFLLFLPGTVRDGESLGFLDALFTATSAVSVTGLVVQDTGTFFTPFGQGIILFLIQIGGLGIMTFSMFFAILMGRRLTIRENNVILLSMGQYRVEGLSHLLKYIIYMTLGIEAIGFISFFTQFWLRHGFAPGESAWLALFYAVGGFCNSGFTIFSNSLTDFRSDPWMIMTIVGLAVAGALGFVVLLDILSGNRRSRGARFRFSLQSKVVLAVTAGIAIIGTLFFFSILGGRGWSLEERGLTSVFLALCAPIAGFDVMRLSELPVPGAFVLMFLIYIGGSPGSTAGGIKTTSLAVVSMVAYSMLANRNRIALFGRAIPQYVVRKVMILFIGSLGLGFLFVLALLAAEYTRSGANPNFFLNHVYEAVSALGTSGSSLGITKTLSPLGKCIVLLAMFVGRVGPLTLALAVAAKERKVAVQYPEENVMVW